MINQNPLTVLTVVENDQLNSLKKILDAIALNIENNLLIPFTQFETVHFARFVIIEADFVRGKPTPAYLVFSSNFDGDLISHLTELFTIAGNGFDQVYSHCKDYKGSGSTPLRIKYFQEHMLPLPNAFYIGHWGLSKKMIVYQNMLRSEIEQFLNLNPQNAFPPQTIKQNITQYLKNKDLLSTNPPDIRLDSLNRPAHVALIIFLTLVLIGFFPVVVVLYFWLRAKEFLDKPIQIRRSAALTAKISILNEKEDFNAQNQLTHLVEIKKGWFRLFTLRAFLWVINFAAKTFYNKGKLGSIPTIHFARWVMIDSNKRLLFFSNFDGSWESYLGDFIDKAAVGLTGVWSNTILFPKTKNLVQNGATDEERFKFWTRTYQIPTQVWYSAYKSLSVVNVINNNEIHQGLYKQMTDSEAVEWLRKL